MLGLSNILTFGSPTKKFLKQKKRVVERINALEKDWEKLSDKGLKAKTLEFKERLKKGETLDDILPEAFATVREASKRVLGQRHYDVQLLGGVALHEGKIAEMKTGEGKTLTATLPVYLNALLEKGVHVITVNDYLARRDAVWMGQIYHFLGLSVACINTQQTFIYDPDYKKPDPEKDKIRDELGSFKVVEDFLRPTERQEAYRADITYGTNHEFVFDYLRDNMAYEPEALVQREPYYAILDEIDFILIDEARTPLIISSPDQEASRLYIDFHHKIIPQLKKNRDYEVDEQKRAITLTEIGIRRLEKILGVEDVYSAKGVDYLHHLRQALLAKELYQRDVHYVVRNNKVIIVDEFTGRLMPDRRWSGGLHQAIEAKEGVPVQPENRTVARITYQNYFLLYPKLAGMTGTAITSAQEFEKIYKLEVIQIPTHKPMIRKDLPDLVFKTEKGKYKALLREIQERHRKGQPLLIGTRSIEKNEYLSKLLKKAGIPHQVLNAKHHEKEAEIIAQAGKLGKVTVATNMAGRGVDIILGGNPPDPQEAKKVRELGGLHVIGTERHESRRIDDQLRGRAGRQGDPGSSQFFLSLEDELLRNFGGDTVKSLMEKLKVPEDEPIESRLVSRVVERAQAKIESLYFDIRKNVLEYDKVLSRHREVFYEKRKKLLLQTPTDMAQRLKEIKPDLETEKIDTEHLIYLKRLLLQSMDLFWMRHLEDMDWLMESVSLRRFAQLNPLVEYKKEGYEMFQEMLEEIEQEHRKIMLSFIEAIEKRIQEKSEEHKEAEKTGIEKEKTSQNTERKLSRNDPCPCGSGKKYKKCCWPKYG